MQTNTVLTLLPVLLPVAFVTLMWTMARFGGWRELAAHYPANHPSELQTHLWGWWERGRSQWWGITGIAVRYELGYSLCVLWRADDEFLHLRLMPILRIFHAPLSIPWSKIQIVGRAWYGFTRVRIRDVPLALSPNLLVKHPDRRSIQPPGRPNHYGNP